MVAGSGVAADLSARRPNKIRNAAWVQALSRWLASTAVTPNQVSVIGLTMALMAGAVFAAPGRMGGWPNWLLFRLVEVLIQGRLLGNLFDGLVAVEGGRDRPAFCRRIGDIGDQTGPRDEGFWHVDRRPWWTVESV